jgi:hypothetical protein
VDLKQVSDNCFAVLNENPVRDANTGLINLDGGVVIDTQRDLAHARRMIELFGRVWTTMPRRVVNTHEDAGHVGGNQLFAHAEIIAHRSVPRRMQPVPGIELVKPTLLFDVRYELELDGTEVHLIGVDASGQFISVVAVSPAAGVTGLRARGQCPRSEGRCPATGGSGRSPCSALIGRNYINVTIGFEELSRRTKRPALRRRPHRAPPVPR